MRCLTVIFLCNFGLSSASLFNRHEAVGMACAIAARDLFTTCNQEDYACFCASSLYVYAVEACISRETHYNSTLMGMAYDKFESSFCEAHNSHANSTNVWSPENQRLNPTVTEKAYKLAFQGEMYNMSQKEQSVWLGLGLIFYWVAVCATAAFVKIMKKIFVRLFAYRMVMKRASRLERFVQRYMLWPALFNGRHMYPFQYFRGWVSFSLPTRFESLVVSIYLILNIIFMLTPYSFMNNDPLFDSRWKEMMRYASDRSGIMATIQFPLLVLFALRNNILQWLCDWSYSSFNAYHRAVARVTYAQLIVHAVMKHIFSASYGGSLVKYYYPVPYFRWGCAAMGLFSLMIMFAMLRGRAYELFYRLHQAMAIGGIVCSIFHLDGIGFKTPLYISFALWGADWILRVGRIFLFNINMFFPPLPGARCATYATARVYEGQQVKLTVTTPVRWVFHPGQYVFLHTNRWTMIGGHPFSVVGSSSCGEGLELVIKARAGLTKKLFTSLDDRSCSPQYPVTIPVYVEGPYGNTIPVEYYEEGLFFAGGIGITGILGYVEAMAKSNYSTGVPKMVRLFWSIRNKSDVDPVIDRISQLSRMDGVYIRIFQRKAAERPSSAVIELPGSVIETSEPQLTLMEEYAEQRYSNPNKSRIVSVDFKDVSEPSSDEVPSPSNRRKSFRKTMSLLPKRKSTVEFADNDEQIGGGNRRSLYGGPKRRGASNRRESIRKSIIGFIESSHPEDDDNFDYGKEEFIEQHRNSTIYNEEDEEQDEAANNDDPSAIEKGLKSSDKRKSRRISFQKRLSTQKRQSRPFNKFRTSKLVDAGFADEFAERRMSMLNPFDDNLYAFEDPSLEDESKGERGDDDDIGDVYRIIEPVGMDIPSLIKEHFKHSDGSICVVGCGPDRMMDTLCWSCCEFLEVARNSRVDYYEEAFKW